MEVIENEYLKVSINLHGGCLSSVIDKRLAQELLWQGQRGVWEDKDIVIFPFVGRLNEKYYTIDGAQFFSEIHGFSKDSEFCVKENNGESVSLFLKSNKDTLSIYPYEFELRVCYTLDKNKLTIGYNVVNLSKKIMYFGIGGHAGFFIDAECSDGFTDTSGNFLEFECSENCSKAKLSECGGFVTGWENVNINRLELKKELFKKEGTLILKGLKSKKLTLVRKNGQRLAYDISSAQSVAIWSHPDSGAYVCIEAWWGLPDSQPPVRELSQKTINPLPPQQTWRSNYSIEF